MNTGGQVNVVAERGLFAPGDNAFVDSRIFKKDKPQSLADYPYWIVLGENVRDLYIGKMWDNRFGQIIIVI